MPLIFSGQEAPYETGVSIQAHDAATGERVVVMASLEAIQDYGKERVKQVASNKYDNRNTEPNGSIFVRTGDCA